MSYFLATIVLFSVLPVSEEGHFTKPKDALEYSKAESLFRSRAFLSASSQLVNFLERHPSSPFRVQALQILFSIADSYLAHFKGEIQSRSAQDENEPLPFLKAFRQKVLHIQEYFQEYVALSLLDYIAKVDPDGPLAERAWYLLGSVSFFRGDYRRSGTACCRLIEKRPNSNFLPLVLKLAILSKIKQSESEYADCTSLVEARQLIGTAQNAYLDIFNKDKEFFERQLVVIRFSLAEKEFQIAEEFRKRGELFLALVWFERVRRNYWGTHQAEAARSGQSEIIQSSLRPIFGGLLH